MLEVPGSLDALGGDQRVTACQASAIASLAIAGSRDMQQHAAYMPPVGGLRCACEMVSWLCHLPNLADGFTVAGVNPVISYTFSAVRC